MNLNENKQENYEYKVQYGTGIQSRISKVHNAIENGKDATNEFSNLLSYLTTEIKEPIREDIDKLLMKYKPIMEDLRNNPTYPEGHFDWSQKHKRQYLSRKVGMIQSEAINEIMRVLMNRLNDMGYLGVKTKQTEI